MASPLLFSPDVRIQAWLHSYPDLEATLDAWILREKFVTRKVMPGLWHTFLKTPEGAAWTWLESGETAPPVDAQPPAALPPPVQPPVIPLIPPLPCATPTQDDLFSVLARGLQGKLQPQTAPLDESRVAALIAAALAAQQTHSRHTITLREPGDTTTHPTDLPMPYWFPRVLKHAHARVHTLLVGPRGCGKTTTAQLLAQVLDLPLACVSLTGGTDEGVLQGWLLPMTDGLRFGYVPSSVVTAYQEGGVVLLDELDGADPNVLMILHAALANGSWYVPLNHGKERLIRHPDFVCLAAANTHGHGADRTYVGRNQLDGATLDRFALGRLTIDYDEAMERQQFPQEPVSFGQRLRARCRAQKGWTRDVSTRNIADASQLLTQLTPDEAWYGYFEDWSDGECGKVAAVRNRPAMTVTLN